MPSEWPPKKHEPKPSGPDPEAVRRAVRDYDKAAEDLRNDKMTRIQWQYRRANLSAVFIDAARAWLAAQDSTGEGSE